MSEEDVTVGRLSWQDLMERELARRDQVRPKFVDEALAILRAAIIRNEPLPTFDRAMAALDVLEEVGSVGSELRAAARAIVDLPVVVNADGTPAEPYLSAVTRLARALVEVEAADTAKDPDASREAVERFRVALG